MKFIWTNPLLSINSSDVFKVLPELELHKAINFLFKTRRN